MTALIPGDPAVTIAGENASPERIEAIREQLGYDRPFLEQYTAWVGNALRGDFGDEQREVLGRGLQPAVAAGTAKAPGEAGLLVEAHRLV